MRGGVAGDMVVIVYSEPLDTRVQVPTRAFVVLAPAFGGGERDVQRVDVCDERVVLTLARPVPFGFGATVAYLPPPAGQIQDRAGNRAVAEAAHGAVWNEQITDCSGRTPAVEDPTDPKPKKARKSKEQVQITASLFDDMPGAAE